MVCIETLLTTKSIFMYVLVSNTGHMNNLVAFVGTLGKMRNTQDE